MKTKVKVVGTNGNAISVSSNNKNYGHIRLEQTRLIVDDVTGFARPKTVTAFMPGLVSDLRKFGWAPGQEVEGTLVVREKLEPFNPEDPDHDLKIAGKTNVICKKGDDKIYRKVFYTTNPDAQDELIEHTNKEEIKAVHDAAKAEEGKADLAKA